MSASPITDALWARHQGTTALLATDAIELCGKLERDLSECLTMLEAVKSHLERGHCGCTYHGPHAGKCSRCEILSDVETTIHNTKPVNAGGEGPPP